jgi:hydrogenase nickel incorporation protein HypA/HybF
MHEYSLVEALVRRVESEARSRGALAVHGLRVSVGELSGVDPELFATAYDTFRAGTVCAGAELALVRVPAAWRCPSCGGAIARGEPLRCAACRVPAELVPGGDALSLDAIDLEVP